MSIAGLGLERAVERFGAALLTLSDADLARELPDEVMAGEGRWAGYGGVREIVFRVYLELRELAVVTVALREEQGRPITQAQRVLAQHHMAWRHLTGALAGVRDEEIDLVPAPGEWPLRTVLEHIIDAEIGFTTLVRSGVTGQPRPATRPEADVNGTLAEIMGRYAALHAAAIDEFATISDEQLMRPSMFWEGYPLEVRFRLLRFDAHLREHTIQVEKTLGWIGHIPSEPERLLRALHNALGEAEAAAIGAYEVGAAEREHLAGEVVRLAGNLTP